MPAVVAYVPVVVGAAVEDLVAADKALVDVVDMLAVVAVEEEEDIEPETVVVLGARRRPHPGCRLKGSSPRLRDVGAEVVAGSLLVGEERRWGWRRIGCRVLAGYRTWIAGGARRGWMKEPVGMPMVCGREGRAMGTVLVALVGLVGTIHAHLVRMRRGEDRSGACFAVAVSEDLQNQHPRMHGRVQDDLPCEVGG